MSNQPANALSVIADGQTMGYIRVGSRAVMIPDEIYTRRNNVLTTTIHRISSAGTHWDEDFTLASSLRDCPVEWLMGCSLEQCLTAEKVVIGDRYAY